MTTKCYTKITELAFGIETIAGSRVDLLCRMITVAVSVDEVSVAAGERGDRPAARPVPGSNRL